MVSKLALGTAQFGSDYGINNVSGKVQAKEVENILNYCNATGIDTIDTAQMYGSSEEVLGNTIRDLHFKIISKLSVDDYDCVYPSFEKSLSKLNAQKLYGFIYHHFDTWQKHPDSFNEFTTLKNENKVNKIGYSLYFPSQLETLFKKNIPFNIVQVPYNIFDRRFETYFPEMKSRGIEIHVRSVFLQGLFFVNVEKLKSHFKPVEKKIRRLDQISKEINSTIHSICLNFVIGNTHIDKIVLGVDNLKNLQDNVLCISEFDKIDSLKQDLNQFIETDESIILPFNWKV
jgi:aryl-alcohol dehydrogenase-like predicted oxidoreductase